MSRAASRSPADSHTVTLITGDRVQVVDRAVHVTPGPGRASITFEIHRQRDHVTVIPRDAAPRIAAGELDLALFDVTSLLANGYGDAQRADLPLIVTNVADPAALQPQLAPRGVTAAHALPALHMMTMRQAKAHGGAALASLAALAPRSLTPGGAPAKIWLDRVRKPIDDKSLPQIGGDVAHARGLTGQGVTVAVVDTGIDVDHPDLAGKVIASRDFTEDGQGTIDVAGHGTHVAGIIAGTGAASGGRFQGVAPDAKLLNARVCEAFGCPDSAILAGMEWAVVEQGAKIVNMSLGADDSAGLDPLEIAVNELSATHGALFAIAAGNDFEDGTIESPGSADAAITVGAVDVHDQLANFSSRGPRAGDAAIKPDLTAPGVAIIAARAHNLLIGTPVDAFYTTLSGTSMATPHVAGAAALVAQQHPAWTGAQIKAQLIASAQPADGLTPVEQGAGRLDVDRGTRQAVVADPPSLDFGVAAFPHDDDAPIVRTVRYHNAGAAPITLALAASLQAPDGSPAASRIALSAAALTVPAGGDAAIDVTLDTASAGADGAYTGRLVASAGDVRIETPLGVEREPSAHVVTFRVRDNHGAPGSAVVSIQSAARPLFVTLQDGDTLRLVDDVYEIAMELDDLDTTSFLVAPWLQLAHDVTLTFDARTARPVRFDPGDPSVAPTEVSLDWINGTTGVQTSESTSFNPTAWRTAQVGPDAPPGEVVAWLTQFHADAPVQTAASRVYAMAHLERDHIPTGWVERVPAAQFAQVDFDVAEREGSEYAAGTFLIPIETPHGIAACATTAGGRYVGPSRRSERYAGPGFVFVPELDEIMAGDGFIDLLSSTFGVRSYLPGHHYREAWNRAVIGPGLADTLVTEGNAAVAGTCVRREGDQLILRPSMLASQSAAVVGREVVVQHEHLALFRDGVLVTEATDVSGDGLRRVSVPPGAASYRFERSITRDPAIYPLSTRIDAAWTFRSAHVAGDAVKPLAMFVMQFEPPVDDHNEVHARAISVPIHFDRPHGATPLPIVKAALEVSFDDGGSWKAVPVIPLGDQAIAIIVHPPGAQQVSLRGAATDLAGSTVEQTIIRAYPVTP